MPTPLEATKKRIVFIIDNKSNHTRFIGDNYEKKNY